jgi:hypothetical protein
MVMGFKQNKEMKEELFCYKSGFGGLDFRLLARNLWIKNREGGGKARQTTNKGSRVTHVEDLLYS